VRTHILSEKKPEKEEEMKGLDYAHLVAYTLTLCFGLFVLHLFVGLWVSDPLPIYEDNLVIRGVETAAAVGFILFGVWGVVYLLRRLHREQDKRLRLMGKRGAQERLKGIVVAVAVIAITLAIGATGSWIAVVVAIISVFLLCIYAFRRDIRRSLRKSRVSEEGYDNDV